MSFVVAATWTASAGHEAEVETAILRLAEATRREPGCRLYAVHRSLDDPRTFLFYERFDDRDAFHAHGESSHFRRYAVEDAFPLLDGRERAFYEVMEA